MLGLFAISDAPISGSAVAVAAPSAFFNPLRSFRIVVVRYCPPRRIVPVIFQEPAVVIQRRALPILHPVVISRWRTRSLPQAATEASPLAFMRRIPYQQVLRLPRRVEALFLPEPAVVIQRRALPVLHPVVVSRWRTRSLPQAATESTLLIAFRRVPYQQVLRLPRRVEALFLPEPAVVIQRRPLPILHPVFVSRWRTLSLPQAATEASPLAFMRRIPYQQVLRLPRRVEALFLPEPAVVIQRRPLPILHPVVVSRWRTRSLPQANAEATPLATPVRLRFTEVYHPRRHTMLVPVPAAPTAVVCLPPRLRLYVRQGVLRVKEFVQNQIAMPLPVRLLRRWTVINSVPVRKTVFISQVDSIITLLPIPGRTRWHTPTYVRMRPGVAFIASTTVNQTVIVKTERVVR